MADRKIKRALIAVYDKTGIVEFARALVDEFGIEIISTGGTARTLKDAGIPVTLVEQVTGFPEMLDGRVKTLHPKIHAAILADRDNPEHMRQLAEHKIDPIDMVVVNLYPFEKTVADPNCKFEDAIEMIDIGGPCLLRAAAKNHSGVLCVCDADSYEKPLTELRKNLGSFESEFSREHAFQAFRVTSTYDGRISRWLWLRTPWADPYRLVAKGETRYVGGRIVRELRYGENPHQRGSVYRLDELPEEATLVSVLEPGGQPLSYNNYVDADAALGLCVELTRANPSKSVCVIIKHTNASGAAVANDPIEAYQRAYLGDPNAAMGGILACSSSVTSQLAESVMESFDRWGKTAGAGGFFIEAWIAPQFDDSAVEIIRTRKQWGGSVRLLAVGELSRPPDPDELDFRRITAGMLVQTRDLAGEKTETWEVVTRRSPTDAELSDLRLAWLIAKHTKSNAISICKDGMLIGNGAGQMSRVMSCRIATWLAKENGHADKLPGSAAASDAFFPFRDGPDLLIAAGVSAIIQPGGSKRDAETIAACDEKGVAMIFTGTRHFKH